jgi:hypothetical protein
MRLSGTLTVITAALAALAATATGADTVRAAPLHQSEVGGDLYDINDLRLTAGFLPKGNEIDGTGFNWSHDYRLALDGMRAPNRLEDIGGFIYGGEVALDTASKNTPGNDFSVTRFMVDIMAGWAYRLNNMPNVHFEGTPFFGIGFEKYHSDVGGSPTAFGYEYGLRAAGYYTFENRWQAGLDLRYFVNHSEPDFGGSIGSVKFETSGLAVLFSGGKRF